MATYGYMRVSTEDQTHNLQEDALEAYGVDRIFTDKITGTRKIRPGLAELLTTVQPGDTVVVWKLDRLGRSLSHLIQVVTDLGDRGVNFVSVTEKIDTTSSTGRFTFNIFGAVAQFERDLISERVTAGVRASIRRNPNAGWGRRKTISVRKEAEVLKRHYDGGSIRGIAKEMKITRGIVYRTIEKYKNIPQEALDVI